MVKVTIDGKEILVEPGTMILRAAGKAGISIPHYCFHPSLSLAGSCRLCVVEIEGAPRVMTACNIPVTDGMVVHTTSEVVKKARENILEFLLLNHPIDCAVCDKAGECQLQDYSFEYGKGRSRFEEPKRVPPFKDLGPDIKLATTRCILCTRCVRFMEEIAGDAQLALVNRGSKNEIAVSGNVELDHIMAGNVVDICPVGALLDKNFIHKTRVWKLESANSVCGECSAGCNMRIDSHNEKIYRIVPRVNKTVNGHWICNTGRYSYKKYAELKRITSPKKKNDSSFSDIQWDEAFRAAADGIGKFTKTKDSVAVILSGFTTNEDAFAARSFLKGAGNSIVISGMFKRPVEEDINFGGGFVIKGDKLPNQNGLQLALGLDQPDREANSVLEKIESGQIKAAYVVHSDTSEIPENVIAVLKKLGFLVVEDVVMSSLAEIADVVLPGKLYFEGTGTFVNYQNRLQLLKRSVAGPSGTKYTWEILKKLAGFFKTQFEWTSPGDLFMELSKQVNAFKEMSHFKIGPAGKPVTGKTKVEEL